MRVHLLVACILFHGATTAAADDWPQWLGPKRDGVWRETGLQREFPTAGPTQLWSAAVHAGYTGPAVANGRVFLMDRLADAVGDAGIPGEERILCFAADSGELKWEHKYDVTYKISYPAGPRATPIVDGDHVYCLGAMGTLTCLKTVDGTVVWSKQLMETYAMDRPLVWGWSAHPMIDGDKLICLVGAKDAGVVAFDKTNGDELWRSIDAKEIGYAAPVIHESNGWRQLIVWHDVAVRGIDIETGQRLWNFPFPAYDDIMRPAVTISNPTLQGNRLLVSDFYNGSLMLQLANDAPDAEQIWSSSKDVGNHQETLNTLMGPAILVKDHIYGFAGDGELRCLEADTGKVVWRDYGPVGGQAAMFATIFIIPAEDRYFLYTDQGELIMADMDPTGYREMGRAKILEATSFARGRDVVWSHPAFANKRMYARNDKQLVCVDLSAETGK